VIERESERRKRRTRRRRWTEVVVMGVLERGRQK
jgi:hypothetical protein